MANIASGAGAGELLTVGATSKAAYAELRDASGNVITGAHKAAVLATQGTMPMSGLDDDTIRLLRVDRSGNLRTNDDTLLFWDGAEGASLNTQRWTSTATTMTAAQTAANGIQLNSGASVGTTVGILLTSAIGFSKYPDTALRLSGRLRYTTVQNQVWELGLCQMGTLSGTTIQIDNGAYWKFGGTTLFPEISAGGSAIATGTDIIGSLSTSNYYTYTVTVEDDRATFICQNTTTGAVISEQVLRVPLASTKLTAVTHLNAWYRCRNGASIPASGGQTWLGEVQVTRLDAATGKSWQYQMANLNMGQEIIPTTFTQTHTMTNAAWPGAASLAAGTASYSTMGGLYQIAATASATTDFPLFGYQIPAPYTFYCTGVHIGMVNTGAANAATPATTFLWALDNGSVASLSAGTHIKYPIGFTSIPISAAIGAVSPDLEVNFDTPIVFQAGRFLDIVLRIVGGAATASQIILGNVTVKGYFE